jgi:hypothetical protein
VAQHPVVRVADHDLDLRLGGGCGGGAPEERRRRETDQGR